MRDLYTFDPDGQVWARSMADLLIHANAAATAARAAGQPRLASEQLAQISAWYRGAVAKGITDNQHRRSTTAKDGRRLARRFRDNQDMILRFATDLAVGFTSNQADYAEFGVMRTRCWMPWHAGRGRPGEASIIQRLPSGSSERCPRW